MSNSSTDDFVHSEDFSVDAEALGLLEEDLAARQSVRSVKSPFNLFIDDLSNNLFKNKFTTLLVIIAMLGSCLVIYWNVFMRLPNPHERLFLENDITEMLDHKTALIEQLSEIDQLDLDEKLKYENARIFNGFPALARWINSIVQHAEQQKLEVVYSIEDATSAPVDGVLEVPVMLQVSPAQGQAHTVFNNMMQLISKMLADSWRLDIVSTTAHGGSNGLSKVNITIEVWLADSDGFARSRNKTEARVIADINSDEEFFQ